MIGVTNEKTAVMEGKYVRLEAISPKYFSQIVAWRNDERVRRYIVQPFLLTEELEKQWYDKYLTEKGHCMFIFISKSNDVPFGTLGYIHYDAAEKICIGTHHLVGLEEYRASKEYTEAALMFHNYLFEVLNVEKVYVHVVDENRKTVSLLKRIGFIDSDSLRFPEFLSMDGKKLSEYILTKQNYFAHRQVLLQLISGTGRF